MRISDWSSDVCSSDLGFDIGEANLAAVANEQQNLLQLAPGQLAVAAELVRQVGDGLSRNSDAGFGKDGAHHGAQASRVNVIAGPRRGTLVRRSEERRGGNECVDTYRSRWSPYN